MKYVFLLIIKGDKKDIHMYWEDNIIIYSIDMYFLEKKREIC